VKVLETDLAKMGEMSANIKVLNERNDHQLQGAFVNWSTELV